MEIFIELRWEKKKVMLGLKILLQYFAHELEFINVELQVDCFNDVDWCLYLRILRHVKLMLELSKLSLRTWKLQIKMSLSNWEKLSLSTLSQIWDWLIWVELKKRFKNFLKMSFLVLFLIIFQIILGEDTY